LTEAIAAGMGASVPEPEGGKKRRRNRKKNKKQE
jgi:hypothetical protein